MSRPTKKIGNGQKQPAKRRTSAQPDTLTTYRQKRDFKKTREPAGKRAPSRGARASASQALSYVVQMHAARQLHYDFRLELDGALLSWAVPKGPSLDPAVKRLARETEPHPLEYGSFEGTIPKGEYGAGAVQVWDRGTWSPEGDARASYRKGRLSFTLNGEKLRGAWHLVRTAPKDTDKDQRGWLLFKSRDDFARTGKAAALDAEPRSALSGRTLPEIAAEVPGAAAPDAPAALPGALRAALSTCEPELATLVGAAPEGPDWLHEIKFDGYRLLAELDAGKVTLRSRNGKDWTERIPTLTRAFAQFPATSALLDGEFVALNPNGVSDFQALQNSLGAQQNDSLVFYAFDLLHLDGFDLRGCSLQARKALLAKLIARQPRSAKRRIRMTDHVVGDGPQFFAKACELGLEGIVSKRADAPYRAGRGRDWLKTKCGARQEFVIVGYSEPRGSRSHLGALFLALREGTKLRYSGRVGTGFSQQSLEDLATRLAPLGVASPAFSGLKGALPRNAHWVKPELVAEVAFAGFTEGGLLRHPRFEGLREDKSVSEVKRERARQKVVESAAPLASDALPKRGPPLTHPDKVLYPELGITKRELFEYYELVAERMLPHVANRPLTLVRCPNGWTKACFFQKHLGQGTLEGVRTVSIPEQDAKAPYAVIDDAGGLFALVQLGALEVHTWGSRADDLERPDLLVFDLDPDPSVEFGAVVDCARHLRAIFRAAKLESFVKTTGGKGLHVCVPIEPDLDWTQARSFCERLAKEIAASEPDKYLANASKARRKGKIFIDYLRNARGATFVAPYSTRARENAPLAVPVDWDELDAKFRPERFTLRSIGPRLKALKRDPFEAIIRLKQRLRPGAPHAT